MEKLDNMNIDQINKERLELIQKARIINLEREALLYNMEREEGLCLCGFCRRTVQDCNNSCSERKNRRFTFNL